MDAFTYTQLHPTFGAEVHGASFDKITPELVSGIREALAKVSRAVSYTSRRQYGVLVFRKTGLDDERHVELSAQFGDLDDIKPFVAGLGQVNRLSSD